MSMKTQVSPNWYKPNSIYTKEYFL
jgi:hypothetical protein